MYLSNSFYMHLTVVHDWKAHANTFKFAWWVYMHLFEKCTQLWFLETIFVSISALYMLV